MIMVNRLRADAAAHPLTIDPAGPRFSWQVTSDRPGTQQVEAVVELALDAVELAGSQALWSSGPITDGACAGVTYDGPALDPLTRYRWRVSVTDEQGAQTQSDWTWFETTLTEADWHCPWIGAGTGPEPAPVLRRTVSLSSAPVRARLDVAALGIGNCQINGRPVSEDRIGPGQTNYNATVLFTSHDVAELLTAGENTLTVELGRGFYDLATPNIWRWHAAPWRAERVLRYRLAITAADGTTKIITSDTDWEWAASATRSDSMYEGETFDAGHVPTAWLPAKVLPGPRGTLTPASQDPVRVVAEHEPQWKKQDDRWLLDFGVTTAGWVKIITSEPAGTKIIIRYGEELDAEGHLSLSSEHVFTDRFQTDELITGDQTDTWESRFSYKGYRFVEVSGVSGPETTKIIGCTAQADVATVAEFATGQPVLQWIHDAMLATVRNNLHHIPTDTPMYEKNGWTGDAQVAAPTMLAQLDLERFLGKWLGDLADSQRPTGQLPVIAPTPDWGYVELAPAPEWTTVYPFLLHQLITTYDADHLLDLHRATVLRYLDWELDRIDADGLAVGVLGDYLALGFGGPPAEDIRLVATAYLIRALRLTAELIMEADQVTADHYLTTADSLTTALNRVFFDHDRGHFVTATDSEYRQTNNVIPLAFDLVPAEHIDSVLASIVTDVASRDDHLNTGALGTSQLLRVLSRFGHADLALRIATQTTAPSWGAWAESGETTMREMWNSYSRSHDHYFMGTGAQWLYETVAGVTRTGPGWRSFTVRPLLTEHLDGARYRLETVRGFVGADWRRDSSGVSLSVEVPVGSVADVSLPGPYAPLTVAGADSALTTVDGDVTRLPSGRWQLHAAILS